MRIDDVLKDATHRLDAAGIAEPRREAASLLGFAIQRPNAFLIAHPEYELTEVERARFLDAVARREKREPFQYITGRQEFWGLEFDVVPGVLIPRPETEVLVEAAIERIRDVERPIFVEAGVGSGCISVSILHSVANATAIATDISPIAIDLARKNAAKHGVSDRLEIRNADLLNGSISGEISLVVSNPPYIPDADIESLQPEVRDYEPVQALAGGYDGLDIIRKLTRQTGHILASGGVLIMEIGAGQAAAVVDLFDSDEWGPPEFGYDLQAFPRVVIATRK
jgi:release factor glutamine methyltransferase